MAKKKSKSKSTAKPTKPAKAKTTGKKAGKAAKPAKTPEPKPAQAPGAPSAPGSSGLYALLMAVDFYLPNSLAEGTYPNLAGCVRDVEHVEAFLRRRLALSDDHLVKLTSTNIGGPQPREPPERRPTYENMVGAFQKITQMASRGDQVYIHYSGHGGQTPTIIPKVKGARALDETLVPMDIGKSSARYLRDIELARLLRSMVDKGLVVTVALDCCHSGGAARDARRPDTNMAVRGVDFVDSTPRPEESLVGTPTELAGVWEGAQGVSRDLVGKSEALGYTLLAACRPHESAYEFAFEGSERNGALTYWWLNALQQLGAELTYRMAYDRILARVHSQFEKQTPLLQGSPDRAVFGTCALHPEFATRVMAVAADGKSVQLGAGQANLLRPGAQFAVYPNGTLDFTQTERRTALLRVRQIAAAESTADVVQVFGQGKVQPGDEAVLLAAPSQKLIRHVRLERADGKPPGSGDRALLAVQQALAGNGWVEAVANPGDSADFVVRLSEDGSRYLICDADGHPLALRPEVGVADSGAAVTVVKRLVHLARYRAVQELENNDSSSPLKGKLVVRLLGVQDDFDPADKPAPRPFRAGEPATLRPGQWTFLSIENVSDRVLNVAVLDLAPSWRITYAYPRETDLDFTPLAPRSEPLIVQVQASLLPGYTSGTDTLKVIATVGPTSFRSLELPALDEPAAPKLRRSATGDPLSLLLEGVTADRPKRELVAAAVPSQGWTVAQVEVRVTTGEAEPRGQDEEQAAPAGPTPAQPAAQPTRPFSSERAPAASVFRTCRDRKLSLWQSVVEEVVARRAAGPRTAERGAVAPPPPLTSSAVQNSDPVLAANALAEALAAGEPLDDPQPVLTEAERAAEVEIPRGLIGTAWKCNKIALQLAWARATGDSHAVQKLTDELAFSSCDPLWAATVAQYLLYFVKDKGSIPYRSGGDYVLDVPLPDQATIALLADWGTGTQTAIDLLTQVARKQPDVVLHLGDIYYSGTQNEVQTRFLDVCRAALGDTPVFSLAGNHDVYSGGSGYYWLVDQLGQQASYFCIRNAHWQFLALDTGYNDFNPFTVSSNVTYLTDTELRWHRAKIEEGAARGLKTVLLSHHQLFSAYEPIGTKPVNELLLEQFRDVLDRVEVWFWGHEHRLDIYAPYLGLRRGRCLGCAAIPEFVANDYYTPKFPVPLLPGADHAGRPVMLGDDGTAYRHAYAIMKLAGSGATVSYYQDTDEANPLYVETIA